MVCVVFRLRMNMGLLKVRFTRKDCPMFVGLPKWPWDSKLVYLGSCANKMMLLIQWLVTNLINECLDMRRKLQ